VFLVVGMGSYGAGAKGMIKNAFTVAIRDYYDPVARVMCRDRVVRTARGKLYLVEEPTRPEEREVARAISLAWVFDWYRFEPWQIERTVIDSSPVT